MNTCTCNCIQPVLRGRILSHHRNEKSGTLVWGNFNMADKTAGQFDLKSCVKRIIMKILDILSNYLLEVTLV